MKIMKKTSISLAILIALVMVVAAIAVVLPVDSVDADPVTGVKAINTAESPSAAVGGKFYVFATIDLQKLAEIPYDDGTLPSTAPAFYLPDGVSITIQAETATSGARIYAVSTVTPTPTQGNIVEVTLGDSSQAAWVDAASTMTYTNTGGVIYWTGYTDPAPLHPTNCLGDVNFGTGTFADTEYAPASGVTLNFNGSAKKVVLGTSGAYTFKLTTGDAFVGSVKNIDGKITVTEWTAGDLTLDVADADHPLLFATGVEIPASCTLDVKAEANVTVSASTEVTIKGTLTNSGNVINSGTIVIFKDALLTNNGYIYNNGTITNNSQFKGDATNKGFVNNGTVTKYNDTKGTINGNGDKVDNTEYLTNLIHMIGTSTLSYQIVDATGLYVYNAVYTGGLSNTNTIVDGCDFKLGGREHHNYGIDLYVPASPGKVEVTNNTFTSNADFTEYMIYLCFENVSYSAKSATITNNTYLGTGIPDQSAQLSIDNNGYSTGITVGLADTDIVKIDASIDLLKLCSSPGGSANPPSAASGKKIIINSDLNLKELFVRKGTPVDINGKITVSNSMYNKTGAEINLTKELIINGILDLDQGTLNIKQGGKITVNSDGKVIGTNASSKLIVTDMTEASTIIDVKAGGVFGYYEYTTLKMNQYAGAIQVCGTSTNGETGIVTLQDVTGPFVIKSDADEHLFIEGTVAPSTVESTKMVPRIGFYGYGAVNSSPVQVTTSAALTIKSGVAAYFHGFTAAHNLTLEGVGATWIETAGSSTLRSGTTHNELVVANGVSFTCSGKFMGEITSVLETTAHANRVFYTGTVIDDDAVIGSINGVSGFTVKGNSILASTELSGTLSDAVAVTVNFGSVTIPAANLTIGDKVTAVIPTGKAVNNSNTITVNGKLTVTEGSGAPNVIGLVGVTGKVDVYGTLELGDGTGSSWLDSNITTVYYGGELVDKASGKIFVGKDSSATAAIKPTGASAVTDFVRSKWIVENNALKNIVYEISENVTVDETKAVASKILDDKYIAEVKDGYEMTVVALTVPAGAVLDIDGSVIVTGTLSDSYAINQATQMIVNDGTIEVAATGILKVGCNTSDDVNIDGTIIINAGGTFKNKTTGENILVANDDSPAIKLTEGSVKIVASDVGKAVDYTLSAGSKATIKESNAPGFGFKADDKVTIDGELTADEMKIISGVKLTINGVVTVPASKSLVIEGTGTVVISSEGKLNGDGTFDFRNATQGTKVLTVVDGGVLTTVLDGSHPTDATKASVMKLVGVVAGANGITVSKGSVVIDGTYTTDDDGTITITSGTATITGTVDEGVKIVVPAGVTVNIPAGGTLEFDAGSSFENSGTIKFESKTSSTIIYEEGSTVNGVEIEVTTKQTEEGIIVAIIITLKTANADKLLLKVGGQYFEVFYVEAFEGDSYADALAGIEVESLKSRVSFDGWYNVLNEKVTSGMKVGSAAPTLTAKFTETPREGVTPYTPSIEPTVITVDETGGYDNTSMLIVAVAMLVVAIFVLGYVVIVKRK